jgi:hypothetical protein
MKSRVSFGLSQEKWIHTCIALQFVWITCLFLSDSLKRAKKVKCHLLMLFLTASPKESVTDQSFRVYQQFSPRSRVGHYFIVKRQDGQISHSRQSLDYTSRRLFERIKQKSCKKRSWEWQSWADDGRDAVMMTEKIGFIFEREGSQDCPTNRQFH